MVLLQTVTDTAVLGMIFGVALLGVLLVGGIAYLQLRKEMALIEAGAYEGVQGNRLWVLAGGLLLVAVGVGQLVESLLAGNAVGVGVTTALVGVAALVYYYLVEYRRVGRGPAGRTA